MSKYRVVNLDNEEEWIKELDNFENRGIGLERKRIIKLIEKQQRIYLNNVKLNKSKKESCWLSGCFSACTEIIRQIKEEE